MKGWTEREAYVLTGNNLYNPYWGPFQGKVRNSRVRRDFAPLAAVNFGISDRNGVYYSAVTDTGGAAGCRGRMHPLLPLITMATCRVIGPNRM